MEDKIINECTLDLVAVEHAYEKEGSIKSYYEFYVLVYGVKVPLIIKDNNRIGAELIKRKIVMKGVDN